MMQIRNILNVVAVTVLLSNVLIRQMKQGHHVSLGRSLQKWLQWAANFLTSIDFSVLTLHCQMEKGYTTPFHSSITSATLFL